MPLMAEKIHCSQWDILVRGYSQFWCVVACYFDKNFHQNTCFWRSTLHICLPVNHYINHALMCRGNLVPWECSSHMELWLMSFRGCKVWEFRFEGPKKSWINKICHSTKNYSFKKTWNPGCFKVPLDRLVFSCLMSCFKTESGWSSFHLYLEPKWIP